MVNNQEELPLIAPVAVWVAWSVGLLACWLPEPTFLLTVLVELSSGVKRAISR